MLYKGIQIKKEQKVKTQAIGIWIFILQYPNKCTLNNKKKCYFKQRNAKSKVLT